MAGGTAQFRLRGFAVTIPWTSHQLQRVAAVLQQHPAASGRCAEAARDVLPIVRERDADARGRKVVPRNPFAPFIVPLNVPGAGRWRHHVTVETEDHYIDALTGPDGSAVEGYLAAHWQYPDALVLIDVDLTDTGL